MRSGWVRDTWRVAGGEWRVGPPDPLPATRFPPTFMGFSRTTSSGALSSRNPRNEGWRSRLSCVHSVNATCPTNRGLTHVATRSRGASLTGVVGTTSFDSSSRNHVRSFAEKPVPTFPA